VERIVQSLGPQPYGVLAIAGFEWQVIEEIVFGKHVDNPVKTATVCSMTALLYLRDPTIQEPWAASVVEADCSPDVLLRNIEGNVG